MLEITDQNRAKFVQHLERTRMTYHSRMTRYGGREGTADWRNQDGNRSGDPRQYQDSPRAAVAETAITWLLDNGIFETVGLAPDGDLLLRLTEKGWEVENLAGDDFSEPSYAPPPPSRRARPRRRSTGGGQQQPPTEE